MGVHFNKEDSPGSPFLNEESLWLHAYRGSSNHLEEVVLGAEQLQGCRDMMRASSIPIQPLRGGALQLVTPEHAAIAEAAITSASHGELKRYHVVISARFEQPLAD